MKLPLRRYERDFNAQYQEQEETSEEQQVEVVVQKDITHTPVCATASIREYPGKATDDPDGTGSPGAAKKITLFNPVKIHKKKIR